MSPRVSVVMPVYNGERFIGEAVVSVLASEFKDLELLVLVDGGTTDASAAEATRASAGDPRVRLIEHPHVAPSVARNIGLMEARGELVANLDADDIMLPTRLALQVAFLDDHPECVAVGSRVLIVDGANRPLRVGVREFTHEEIDAGHLGGHGGTIINPTATFRRQSALEIGGYADDLLTTGEDLDFWLRLAEVGRLVNLPSVLVRYRIHGRNASVGDDGRERRLAVTLSILKRTFARRGITDRQPSRVKRPPYRSWQRWSDRALVRYFSGNRRGALLPALVGVVLKPTAQAARAALSTVLSGPLPQPHSGERA